MALLHINRLGHDITNVKGFLIDRPKGCGDYLFLHFKTALQIRLDGRVVTAPKDSCILFTPDYPQWFYSPESELKTNWLHFTGNDDQTILLLKKLDLPLNALFQPVSLTFLDPIFQSIRNELIMEDLYRTELIGGVLMQFLAKLARFARQEPQAKMNAYKRSVLDKLKAIRMELQNKPEHKWTIGKMAAMVQLSETRFSFIYKEVFQVSPKQDLIQIRLEKAKYLLMNEAATVQEVANMTGYENVFHFIRQFKKYVGCSPGKFYNN